MKVYVAGSSQDTNRVRFWIERLKANNVEVVSTWVDVIDKVGLANPYDATVVQRQEWSELDLAEVMSADVVWVLVPPPTYSTKGAWVEAGFSYAKDKRLIFSGDTKQSIFCALGEEYVHDDAAFNDVLELDHQRQAPALQAPQISQIDLRPKQPVTVAPSAATVIEASQQARVVRADDNSMYNLADAIASISGGGFSINRSQLTPRYLEIEFDSIPNVYFTVRLSPISSEPFTISIDDYREPRFRSIMPSRSTDYDGVIKAFTTFLMGVRVTTCHFRCCQRAPG